MKNILRALALPLIALTFFVAPGEARAWTGGGWWTPPVYSDLWGKGISGLGSRNVYVRYYTTLSDGTFDSSLTPGQTVTAPSFPETTFEIYPGATRTSYYDCTDANASAAIHFYRKSPTFCYGPPDTMVAAILSPDNAVYGNPYQSSNWTTLWNGAITAAWPMLTVVVVNPTPTITSSNPAVISCATGTSCTSEGVGSATLTVSFPATLSREYDAWCYGGCDYVFAHSYPGGPYYYYGPSAVPATSITIPVTVSPVAPPPNLAPSATITAPVALNSTITQGDSLPFAGTGTDPEGGPITYEWTYGSCGGQLISGNQSFDLKDVPGFPTGPSTIYFRVRDVPGAWSPCDSRMVTVNPPVPPAPTFGLYTSPSPTAGYGSTYIVGWNSVTNATSCTASGDWTGNKTILGATETMTAITTSRTHTLTCTGIGGTTAKTVTILPITSPPTISFLNPDTTPITANTSAILYWNAFGPGTVTCSSSATPGNALWSGPQPLSDTGGFTTSSLTANTTFTLMCSNAWGSDTKSTTVTVTGGASFCGNNLCESGENPLTCAKDCKVKYKQF